MAVLVEIFCQSNPHGVRRVLRTNESVGWLEEGNDGDKKQLEPQGAFNLEYIKYAKLKFHLTEAPVKTLGL